MSKTAKEPTMKRIVCSVCGDTVMTFDYPHEVEPSSLLTTLRAELVKHGRDPVDLDNEDVLREFVLVDEDMEAERLDKEMGAPELFYYGDDAGWW
jgi:hypothetical protein